MLFAIDIGNTNMVIGCIDGDKILFSERLSTDHSKTALEYALEDHVLQCQNSGARSQERSQDLHGQSGTGRR